MSLIQVKNLSKIYKVYRKKPGFLGAVKGLFHREYNDVRAVDGVSFDIEKGEMVAFLGPNGAGKTTTLKMLSGLIYPTGGTANVMDHIPWQREDDYRRRFSLVMGQKNQLWWDLPAEESFILNKEIYGVDDRSYRERLEELTELLQVTEILSQPVREVSLGERMKLELIAALLHSPEVLFLDEPTIGLDVIAQRTIRECIARYNREKDVTILLTSHYMRDVEELCQRVLVINHGKIEYDGNLTGILEKFAQHKLLHIRFRNSPAEHELKDFGIVVKNDPPTATIEVARASVLDASAQLMQKYDVEDLSIEEVPIEEVMANMFETKGPENGNP
ncbi:MAG: ATP-binding cassette domain-containing protein [Planctomycetota bacterium]|nr:ATP-binding cassette domain-containing protein [Planctomycetota bacterium]MDP7130075.1 ATP-binding cassette domain-containing protein [Planctomycetota bacterium]MDP7249738.1 ATP-binding cassette domain-containing protein [Planctomycetota bacterium]